MRHKELKKQRLAQQQLMEQERLRKQQQQQQQRQQQQENGSIASSPFAGYEAPPLPEDDSQPPQGNRSGPNMRQKGVVPDMEQRGTTRQQAAPPGAAQQQGLPPEGHPFNAGSVSRTRGG